MQDTDAPQAPPHCPNRHCRFYKRDRHLWRYIKVGFYWREATPHRVQRWRCVTCRRFFGASTFRATYWLKRPKFLALVFRHLAEGPGIRQLARALRTSPQTVAGHSARIGRLCLLFHLEHGPRGPVTEPLALDGFESFAFSQYHPVSLHVLAGQRTHFFYGFTESELRRKGTMRPSQRKRRAELEARLGRPDPKSVEKEVAELLRIVARESTATELHTDEHPAYPRALRRIPWFRVHHRTTSSRAARTARNPLFAINLLDALLRHALAQFRRETISFCKRLQGAIERTWHFLVQRNYVKSFSERDPGETPAMRLGLFDRPLTAENILARRRFPGRVEIPERWQAHYSKTTPSREHARLRTHRCKYAF